MRIVRVRAAGFRGIRDSIDVPVPRGFLVITGRNGTGKTTVCDAIEYALTGALERYSGATEGRESLKEYIWWRGDDPAREHYVEVHLADEDDSVSVIRRDRSSPTSIPEVLAASLCTREDAPKDWPAQMCRTSIIRDDTIAGFSFDLAETDRFEFVRASVGSTDVEPLVSALNEFDKRLEKQGRGIEAEYNAARDRVMTIREEASSLRSRMSSREDSQHALHDLRALLGMPEATGAALITAANERHLALKRREALLSELGRSIEQRAKQLDRLGPDFPKRLAILRAEMSNIEKRALDAEAATTDAEVRRAAIATGQTRIAAMEALSRDAHEVGLREGRCPVCRSTVSLAVLEDGLADLRVEVDKKSIELREAGEVLERIRSATEAIRKEGALKRSELSRIEADAEVFEADAQRLAEMAAGAGISADVALSRASVDSELSVVRRSLGVIQHALATVEAETDTGRLADLERTVVAVQQECDDLSARQTKVEAARERGKSASKTIRRVAGEVLEDKLVSLAPLLSDLYLRIRPHANWRDVQYRLRGDVRRFLSLRVGPDLNPRFIFSSGQRRAAGLAFLLSVHLSRTWCKLETLVLDDPVQHIDDFRALHLVEVLSAIRQTGKQVICSVEDGDLAALLSRRLRPEFGREGMILTLGRAEDGSVATNLRTVHPMSHVLPFSARSA